MTASVGMVVMVVVGEESEGVSEVHTHEESRPGSQSVVAEAHPVVAHEREVPEPDGGFSVVLSPDLLAVDLWVQLDHVSNSGSPWISDKGGPETGEKSASRVRIAYPSLRTPSGADLLCLIGSSLSMQKSNRYVRTEKEMKFLDMIGKAPL